MTNVADTTTAQSQDYQEGYAEGLAEGTGVLDDERAELRELLALNFRLHGPADERHCDWTRTLAEPWASLAEVLT